MKKTAILLMILTLISKAIGFFREIILSYIYGASNISDAYLISITIPGVMFGLLGLGISTGYIPMYSNIQSSHGENECNKYTNNLINILFIICTGIILFGILFTEPIVRIFASGFQGETMALAVKFTKISVLGIYFTAFIYVAKPFLQLKGNYTVPALIGIPLNLIIILSIFISSKTNVMILSIGNVIATIFQLMVLIPFLYSKGYKYEFLLNIKDKYIKSMSIIALPIMIGASVDQVNTLIDRTIASNLVVGGISALNYANRLNGFIQGIFVMSVVTVLYPTISKMAADFNMDGFKNSISEAINSICLLVMPATIGSIVFSQPIVRILFGRGAFNANAVSMTSIALLFYSIGMVGSGLREVLSRAFYSLQDTKTPMINAFIGVITNIVLNLILSVYMGIAGLALATSISSIATALLLLISLRKKIGSFGIKKMSISFIKILFSSLLMGIIAKLAYNGMITLINQNVALLIAIIIGAISYFTLIYFMKIEDAEVIVNAIKRKITKATA